MTEEEMVGKAAPQIEDDRKIYRLRLKKDDFVKYGFTQGCPGCQALEWDAGTWSQRRVPNKDGEGHERDGRRPGEEAATG